MALSRGWTEARMYHAIVKRIALQNFLRVNQKDYAPILKSCSPDVHHRFGGHHALGGERHDREALRRWFERLGRLAPTLQLTVHDVWAKGGPWNTTVIMQCVRYRCKRGLTTCCRCGSSKLNAAESLMQEAPPWKAALCMAWSSTALGVPRSARGRGFDCQDPGVNLPPILTAKEFGSELEIVRPRLCSGDADHRVAAER